MKLTAEERRNLPSSAFALPELREFPVNDYGHTRAAAGRISQAWHAGRLSYEEHERALKALRRAEGRFGITPGEGSFNAFEDGLRDGTKLALIASMLGATGLVAWLAWRAKNQSTAMSPYMAGTETWEHAYAKADWSQAPSYMPKPTEADIAAANKSANPAFIKQASGPGGLQALADSLSPAQKAAVHTARAHGMSPVDALRTVGITPAQLAAAARG